MRSLLRGTIILACLSSNFIFYYPAESDTNDYPDRFNVVWTEPGEDSSDSMPIGNGDIGANVWSERNGDIVLLLSKVDSWDENGQLLKLGRIRFALTPPLVEDKKIFTQTLNLRDGTILFDKGGGELRVVLRVDANLPVVVVEFIGVGTFGLKVSPEVWRTAPRHYTKDEVNQSCLIQRPEEGIVYPDVIVNESGFEGVAVYHHNKTSVWGYSMDLQGLGAYKDRFVDPLKDRVFGYLVWGEGLKKGESNTLLGQGLKVYKVYVLCDTMHPGTGEKWVENIKLLKETLLSSIDTSYERHKKWWEEFWQRSWVILDGDEDARKISQMYTLQRWITACGSRGKYPVKFNGSIFTVEWREKGKVLSDPDYRRWGGAYWWQNTRLPYWPLLSSGDFDLMKPLFGFYMDVVEISKIRNKVWWDCEGIYMPETMYFWGLHRNADYGFNREGIKVGDVTNRWIRWIWGSGVELIMMMQDYYEFTEDKDFFEKVLLKYSEEIFKFFETKFSRDSQGKLMIYPSQAVETYQKGVTNDTPTIAGLHAVLRRFLSMKNSKITDEMRQRWQNLLNSLVPVPEGEEDGKRVILPAQVYDPERGNVENPELYPVFPYRLYGIGKENLEVARNTFYARKAKEFYGWQQDAIQSAMLGLVEETKKMLIANVNHKDPESRFPAFWGPNYDWIPDQCHGGNIMSTLQFMLLQWDGEKIYLFPAWDKKWDVDFKLYAPYKTVVRVVLRKGKIEILDVVPKYREKDLVVCLGS
ncbi:MAG: DUF5703 domain-containing protein [Candidatus Hydrogenedentes bacterium]|nr:DUF5703 domain-containing protein [Candidatus Hydrogenedentota bacterium]